MPFLHEDLNNEKEENKAAEETSLEPKESSPKSKKIDGLSQTGPEEKATKSFEEPKEEQKLTAEVASKEALFTWQAPEYTHYEKGVLWYLAVVICGLLLAGVAFYFHQWLLIAVIVMFVIVFIQYGRRQPQTRNYSILENGIKIDDKFYTFKEFRSFWFIESPEETTLNFQPTKRFALIISLPLSPEIKAEELREVLIKYLPEKRVEEGFIDQLGRWLKF